MRPESAVRMKCCYCRDDEREERLLAKRSRGSSSRSPRCRLRQLAGMRVAALTGATSNLVEDVEAELVNTGSH